MVSWFFTCNAQEVKIGLPIGHFGTVDFAKFHPNGKFVVKFANDYIANVWDVESGKLLHYIQGRTTNDSFLDVNHFIISPNGKLQKRDGYKKKKSHLERKN